MIKLAFPPRDTASLVTALVIITPLLLNPRIRRLIRCYFARLEIFVFAQKVSNVSDGKKAQVNQINVYPVKSLRAVSVTSQRLDAYGFAFDRHLMVVVPSPVPIGGSFVPGEATHAFISQRQAPTLTSVNTTLPSDSCKAITLSSDMVPEKQVTINVSDEALSSYKKRFCARLWDDTVEVADVGDEAASFISEVICKDGEGFKDARLVIFFSSTVREVDSNFVPAAAMHRGNIPRIAFPDEFPVLIACESSLNELNRRLVSKGKDAIPMSRFRPNIVIKNTEPFEEDDWKTIKIGDLIFHVVKACPRCKQSCIDQKTGKRYEEPLETLAEFRALGKNPEDYFFGTNAILQGTAGIVNVGDNLTILSKRDTNKVLNE